MSRASWKHVLRIPDSMRSFGEALRWVREQRGMTLRALAREVGVSPPFQSDLEHDRRTTAHVADYARVLGIDVAELESRQGFTRDLKDWLSEHPELIELLRDIRACHCKPLVLKRLTEAAREQKTGER